MRIFDISTSRCIDYVHFESIPLSISINITGEFIATSHTDSPGIYLWSNKSFYENINLVERCNPSTFMLILVFIDLPDNSNSNLVAFEEDTINHELTVTLGLYLD